MMNDDRQDKDEKMTVKGMLTEFPRLRDDVSRLLKDMHDIKVNAEFLADPFLESHSVCEFLCMSYRQLKYYVQQGEIEPYYNGSRLLFRASELRRFVNEVLKVRGRKRDLRNL